MILKAIFGPALALNMTLLLVGCNRTPVARSPESTAAEITDEQLRSALDEVLSFTYRNRRLNTSDHAAWQILHGALAYQREFKVMHDGQLVSAVDHLLAGQTIAGWNFEHGPSGPRALVEPGTDTSQGHSDQWLAILAQCEVDPDRTITIRSKGYKVSDWIRQVQQDVRRNVLQEYSWTLIALTSYLKTDAEWNTPDGSQWSIERLLAIETEHDLNMSACGGTHRLTGMSMALNRHLAQGGRREGAWEAAENKIDSAIQTIRQFQNPDGGFSSGYLSRPGRTPDLGIALGATGHTLEFLSVSLTDQQLSEPWVKRAVWYLCEVFRTTRDLDLECGALYHAAHGLAVYRERMFGAD